MSFWAKNFYQHFQIFSIYIYSESLPIKSYQFFKICKRLDKKREKKRQSVRKEKMRKVGLFLPLRLEGVETLKYRCVCRPTFGKV